MRRWVALALGLAASGCVTVYHPLVGLQRPVAVDLARQNLTGLRVRVWCLDIPGRQSEAWELCPKLRTLLTAQGADVEASRLSSEAPAITPVGPRPDLTVTVKAVLVADDGNPLSWVLSVASATLLPGVNDTTWEQEVTVRDATGFILARETFRSRFVRSFGLGALLVSAIVDLTLPEQDRLLAEGSARTDFTSDLLGQLTQLLVDARVKTRVLSSYAPTVPTPLPGLPGLSTPPPAPTRPPPSGAKP